MNKKGFTLVELLSVVIILSILIVVVATNGFGLFNKAKEKITEEQYKIIEEAANILMVDVRFCDDNLKDFESLSSYFTDEVISNCTDLQSIIKGKTVNLEKLKENYLTDTSIESITDDDIIIRVDVDSFDIEIEIK